MCLTECVSVAVLGHFSITGGPCEEHFHFKETATRLNFTEVQSTEEALKFVIEHFSPEEGTILDISGVEGIYITYNCMPPRVFRVQLFCTNNILTPSKSI